MSYLFQLLVAYFCFRLSDTYFNLTFFFSQFSVSFDEHMEAESKNVHILINKALDIMYVRAYVYELKSCLFLEQLKT